MIVSPQTLNVESELLHQASDLIKQSLLEKYADREPQLFRQMDCFIGEPNDHRDCIMRYDADGHSCFGSATHELMRGASVRVLIQFDLTPAEAAAALRKLADMAEQGLCFGDHLLPNLRHYAAKPCNCEVPF